MASKPWKPVLDGEVARTAAEAIDRIAAELVEHPVVRGTSDLPPSRLAGLPGGLAGIAVFFGYLAAIRQEQAPWDRAESLLERCIELVAENDLGPALHGGFLGTAWAIHHLHAMHGGEGDPVEEIDTAIADMLESAPWEGDYDLILGLVGFATYALERLPRLSARRILDAVATHLHARHEESDDGVTWFTPPRLLIPHQLEQHPEGFYNLGLAHGVPGVIGVLGPMVKAEVQLELTRPMLAGAVKWLRAQQRDGDLCAFSYNAGDDTVSRAAWCYGDPGVASALWIAGDAVGHAPWSDLAVEIALASTAREENSGVVDGGICHGSVGLGLIYQRFFHRTGDERFAAAARRWYQHGLDHRRDDGVGGFPSWSPQNEDQPWEDDPGFLNGAAGVGLGLLSATSNVAPEWDRSLLISAGS